MALVNRFFSLNYFNEMGISLKLSVYSKNQSNDSLTNRIFNMFKSKWTKLIHAFKI